jgi:hypothetical protein
MKNINPIIIITFIAYNLLHLLDIIKISETDKRHASPEVIDRLKDSVLKLMNL